MCQSNCFVIVRHLCNLGTAGRALICCSFHGIDFFFSLCNFLPLRVSIIYRVLWSSLYSLWEPNDCSVIRHTICRCHFFAGKSLCRFAPQCLDFLCMATLWSACIMEYYFAPSLENWSLHFCHLLQSNFEFQLRLQEFIELVRTSNFLRAIAYARKFLAPWGVTHMKELQHFTATLAFKSTTSCPKYKVSYILCIWSM